MSGQALPKWVVDNQTSLEEEARPWRGASVEAHWRAVKAACQAAAKQLSHRADAARIYAYQDPLPESTVQALKRLQTDYRRQKR